MRRNPCLPVGCFLPVAHGFTPAGFGWSGSFSLVLTAVYGPDHVADLHAQRIRSLFGDRSAIGTDPQP